VFSTESQVSRQSEIMRHVRTGKLAEGFDLLAPALIVAPFSRGVSDVIVAATTQIVETEWKRGAVAKRDRAFLADEAQPYQDFVDRVLFTMAGINDKDAAGLTQRLAKMM
jgi:hypothetical protein